MIITEDEAVVTRKFKDTWISLLHHVCNEHEWSSGSCNHDANTVHELPWFCERDQDFKALQTLVLDPKFLESLKFYTFITRKFS